MKEPVQTLRILALVTLMNVSMVLLQFEKDGFIIELKGLFGNKLTQKKLHDIVFEP